MSTSPEGNIPPVIPDPGAESTPTQVDAEPALVSLFLRQQEILEQQQALLTQQGERVSELHAAVLGRRDEDDPVEAREPLALPTPETEEEQHMTDILARTLEVIIRNSGSAHPTYLAKRLPEILGEARDYTTPQDRALINGLICELARGTYRHLGVGLKHVVDEQRLREAEADGTVGELLSKGIVFGTQAFAYDPRLTGVERLRNAQRAIGDIKPTAGLMEAMARSTISHQGARPEVTETPPTIQEKIGDLLAEAHTKARLITDHTSGHWGLPWRPKKARTHPHNIQEAFDLGGQARDIIGRERLPELRTAVQEAGGVDAFVEAIVPKKFRGGQGEMPSERAETIRILTDMLRPLMDPENDALERSPLSRSTESRAKYKRVPKPHHPSHLPW